MNRKRKTRKRKRKGEFLREKSVFLHWKKLALLQVLAHCYSQRAGRETPELITGHYATKQ